jgi:hypothetical protein
MLNIFRARTFGPLSEDDARRAFASLPTAERILNRRLIARQLRFSPRVSRDLERYGPTGTVQLYSARAFQAYEFCLAIAGTIAAFSGVGGELLGPLMILIVLVAVLCILRVISASRSGKRFRAP